MLASTLGASSSFARRRSCRHLSAGNNTDCDRTFSLAHGIHAELWKHYENEWMRTNRSHSAFEGSRKVAFIAGASAHAACVRAWQQVETERREGRWETFLTSKKEPKFDLGLRI